MGPDPKSATLERLNAGPPPMDAPHDVAAQPTQLKDPNAQDPIARIKHIEAVTGGTLPSSMSLTLAQGPMDDMRVGKAARMLASKFDLSPDMVFAPYTANNIGQSAANPWYADPVNPAMPISVATARRFMAANEQQIVRRWLQAAQRPTLVPVPEGFQGPPSHTGIDPGVIASIFAAFAPIQGEHVPLQDALGAAVHIARGSKVTKATLQLLATNLAITAQSTALTPMQQIAAAHTATAKHITLRSLGDIPGAVIQGPLGNVLAAGQVGAQELAAIGPTPPRLNPIPGQVLPPEQQALLKASGGINTGMGQLNISFYKKAEAGLLGSGDWLKFLDNTTMDYAAEGTKLAAEQATTPIPFANTVVGRYIGKGLNLINRPLDAAYRAVMSPLLDPVGSVMMAYSVDAIHSLERWKIQTQTLHAVGGGIGNMQDLAMTGRDMLEIIHGHQSAGAQLEKEFGLPMWSTAVGELVLAAMVAKVPIIQFAVDPVGAGLQSWEAYKAHFLVSGLAEDAMSAEAKAKIINFRDSSVSHIGDLRHTNPVDYLYREIGRTDDPEKFFNRALSSFKTWRGVGGIDVTTANRIWKAGKALHAAGASDDLAHRVLSSVIDGGFGIEPEIGSLGAEVRSLAENQAAVSTADVQQAIFDKANNPMAFNPDTYLSPEAQVAKVPIRDILGATSTGNPDVDMALSTLDDALFDARAGRIHMVEVPHHQGPLGALRGAITSQEEKGPFGRMIRSWFQENPKRSTYPNMEIPLEGNTAVPDFTRAMLRSQVYGAQDLAYAEREWAAAIDPLNPNRTRDAFNVAAKYNAETISRINARFGASAIQDMILEEARHRLGGRSHVFAAFEPTTEGTGPKLITEPFWTSQLDNFVEMVDPVLYREGISNIMGTVTKWRRGMADTLGIPMKEFDLANAGKITPQLEVILKEVVDGSVGQAFQSVWKPLIIGRPAHISRVVIVNEQSKALAVMGAMRWAKAGKKTANLLERTGAVQDTYMPTGIDLATRMGQRDNTIEDALLALDGTGKPRLGTDLGFSPEDAEYGHALAEAVRAGGIRADDRAIALELVSQYRDQLLNIGIDTSKLGLKGSGTKMAAKALRNEVNISAGNYRFRLPGLLPDDPLANANFARQYMSSAEFNSGMLKGLSPSIGAVERGQPQFLDSLYAVLQNQAGKNPVGKMQLEDLINHVPFDRAVERQMAFLTDPKGDGPRYAMDLMGRSKVGPAFTAEDLRAKLEQGNNYVRQLAGKTPSIARAALQGGLTMDALRAIPTEDLPALVHGNLLNETFWHGNNFFRRLRDRSMSALMETPTNVLSRQKFFHAWQDRMLKGLMATEASRNPGVAITDEKLAGFETTSRNFALGQVDRIMFDYSRSNRIEEMTRLMTVFTHPFLAFPLTFGRILRSNPSVIRESLLLGRAGLQSGFVKEDPTTGEYTISESWLGGAAPLLAMLTGTHIGVGKFAGGGWSLSAPLRAFVAFSESAFPLPTGGLAGDVPLPMPGLAPPFEFVLQQFLKHQDMSPHLKMMLSSYLFQYGEIGPSNWQGFLPSYLRHGLEAAFPDQFKGITNNNIEHFLQVQEAMGLPKDIGQARLHAREFAFMRIFFSGIFPAAPQISFPTKPLEDEYKTLTDPVTGLGFQAGRAQFLKIHPDLTLLTTARTMWGKDNPSPVSLPANKFVQQLLSGKGAKEFAAKYPEWVFAIIPSELGNAEFDPGAFFAQLATGQRVTKDPQAFLDEEQVQQGWDSFFLEQQIHNNWLDLNPQLGQTDPGYTAETARHNQAIQTIESEHPKWRDHYVQTQDSGVDPAVLRPGGGIARELAVNPIFAKTDVGAGLVDYLKLRDDIYNKLGSNNLSTLDAKSAHDLGFTSAYEQGVNAIVAAHPDFYTAYRLFFSSDLRGTGPEAVVTAGQQQSLDIRAQDPEYYTSKVDPWWKQFEVLRVAPDAVPYGIDKGPTYEAIRDWVNNAYTNPAFPANKNPMELRWASYSPLDKTSYLSGLIGRPYEYITRFDRTQLMGTPTDTATEDLWSTYEQLRSKITEAANADPNFSRKAAYGALDSWVIATAKSNPNFAQQVVAANTLGYNFARLRRLLFPATSPQTDASWTAFLDSLGQVQTIVNKFGLTGTSDYNPTNRSAYRALGQALQAQADALGARDLGFAQQWKMLEDTYSGTTSAIEQYFLPSSYYAIGNAALNEQPSQVGAR